MTLEEAKKILEKEFVVISLHKSTEPFEFDESVWIEHEKPSVLEAFRVLSKGGYYISIIVHDYDMRKKRLQKENEKNAKAPGSSENRIKEDSGVNPALKESASQFNDALLDEQAKKIKRFGNEITRLNKIIHKKNEELRLTKIREKNLADKVVDEIDVRALKSAESSLAYKENVIAEKDEVIADLGNELAATKKELEEKTKLVEEVRKYSKEYREYGIEAVKMIRKMAKAIVRDKPVSLKDFKEYRRLANGYSFNSQLFDFSEEEKKKLDAAKYAKSTLDELKDKAYESFNAKAHKLGLVGSKDGKGIPDQMIRVDIAEELSKVLDDAIDQFLLFGEIIIKE